MNPSEQLHNVNHTLSDRFINEIRNHHLMHDEVIVVTVFDQECLHRSNKRLFTQLKIFSALFGINIISQVYYLTNIEKLFGSASVHIFLTISCLWVVLTFLFSIFIFKKVVDISHELRFRQAQLPAFIKFDQQPVVGVKLLEYNAYVNSMVKPLCILLALFSLQSISLFFMVS